MAVGQGTAVIDFGLGSNEAQVTVSGQTAILATSKVEAFIMADDTSDDHTANDHKYASLLIGLSCGTPVAATGFIIYGRCLEKINGKFTVRFVWAD